MQLNDDEKRALKDAGVKLEDEGGRDQFSGKARMVVRLVAGGFILVGFMDLLLYWAKCRHDQTSMNVWQCVYLSIPLVMGVLILLKTPALAQRIEDWLEQ